jgi:hypothetical protein
MDSDYWLRLRFCGQVLQYISALRTMGRDIKEVVYDVVRKPSIAPKSIPMLDEQGCKIVLDIECNRIFKKDGTPRESADAEKGYVIQSRLETPEEFCGRLVLDCQERPEFYFARREVPILEQDLREFEIQRLELSKMILSFRRAQKRVDSPEQAWPRNCNGMTCKSCQFSGPCLQNLTINAENIPAGFMIGKIHNELEGVI